MRGRCRRASRCATDASNASARSARSASTAPNVSQSAPPPFYGKSNTPPRLRSQRSRPRASWSDLFVFQIAQQSLERLLESVVLFPVREVWDEILAHFLCQ